MDKLFIYLAVFSLFSQAKGSDMPVSVQSTADCKLVYMCPTFCLKSKGKCFVCDCGEPMRSFMKSASDRMKHEYQSTYQTGSQFINGQMGNQSQKSAGSGNQAWPFSKGALMGGRNWMNIGRASDKPPQWIGGVNAMTGMGQQWNVGQGSIGAVNQGKLAPMITTYLQPDFQEFYRPMFGVMPGRCPQINKACPKECWKINGFTGCMYCACPSTTAFSTPTDSAKSTHSQHQTKSTRNPLTTGKYKITTVTPISTLETSISSNPSQASSHITSKITSYMTSRSALSSQQTPPVISTLSPPLNRTSSVATDSSPVSVDEQSTKLSLAKETMASMEAYASPIVSMTSSTPVSFPKEMTIKNNTAPTTSISVMTTSDNLNLHHSKYQPPITARSGGFVNDLNVERFETSPGSEGGSLIHLQKLLGLVRNTSLHPVTIIPRTADTTGNSYWTPEFERLTENITTPKHETLQIVPTSLNSDRSESVIKSATEIQQLHSDTLHLASYQQTSGVKHGSEGDKYNAILEFFREIDSGEKDKAMALLQNLFTDVNESGSLTSKFSRTGNMLHGTKTSTEKSVDPTKSSDITTNGPERQSIVHTHSNAETFTSPTTDTGGTNELEKGRQSMSVDQNEVHFCPEAKTDCADKNCHMYDTLRQCMLCICDDVGISSTEIPNQTTRRGQPDTSPVCRSIPEDCADECLFLDGTNYFCPVCKCEHKDLTRKRPQTISTAETCPPLNKNCPRGCGGFNIETFCPWCKC